MQRNRSWNTIQNWMMRCGGGYEDYDKISGELFDQKYNIYKMINRNGFLGAKK